MKQELYGNLGDIWLHCASKRIYKSVLFKRNGEEHIHTFPAKDLQKWLLKVEVPASEEKQRYFKNNFPRTQSNIEERFKVSKEAKIQKTKYLKLKTISDENLS